MSSTAFDNDAKAWASSLAAKLRLIQSAFETDQPATRQGFLAEEIERALKPLPPSRRAPCLGALEEHFPAWQPEVKSQEAPALPSLDDLVDLLKNLGPGLSDEVRSRVATELVAAKVIPESARPASSGQNDELWKRFGRTGGAAPHTERTLKLLNILNDYFMTLDQLAWTLWRNIGSKSAYRKESEFNKIAGPYLAADPEVSTDQIRQTVERTRKLVAALLGAATRGAADFSSSHSAAFSPEQIEQAARQEKRALESLDAASWREYKERFKARGAPPQVENAIQVAVAQAAEDLIGGRAR